MFLFILYSFSSAVHYAALGSASHHACWVCETRNFGLWNRWWQKCHQCCDLRCTCSQCSSHVPASTVPYPSSLAVGYSVADEWCAPMPCAARHTPQTVIRTSAFPRRAKRSAKNTIPLPHFLSDFNILFSILSILNNEYFIHEYLIISWNVMQSYTAFPNSPNKNSKMCVFLYKMAPIYPMNATKQQKKGRAIDPSILLRIVLK